MAFLNMKIFRPHFNRGIGSSTNNYFCYDEDLLPVEVMDAVWKHMKEHNEHTWVIDWDKIYTLEDLKQILKNADIRPISQHVYFDNIKQFCKLIDLDGREIDPATGHLKS